MRTLRDRRREEQRAEADDRLLESRSDRRRDDARRETAFKRLARRLVDLDPRHLARLQPNEALRAAIQLAQAIRSPRARNRQIAVVRQHLRADDADELEVRLHRLLEGKLPASAAAPADERATAIAAWQRRLVEGGDPALSEFLAQHSALERHQELRQLLRVIDRSGPESPGGRRALDRLRQAISQLVVDHDGAADDVRPTTA